MTDSQEHLLDDMQVNIQQASTGKRFANYIIDLIVFYIIIAIIGVAMIPSAMTAGESHLYVNPSSGEKIMSRLIALLFYGVYMFLVETLFKGKSLGKLITRTRAVNEDGSPITAGTALLRGLSRIVPFEQFSALGSPSYPWHDRWTRTYVIDEKLSGSIR